MLGLDPDPAKLWPEAVARADARRDAARGPRSADRRGGRPALPRSRSRRRARRASPSSRSSPASSGSARTAGRRSSETVAAAHEHGLLVIADGKRGDVAAERAGLRAGARRRTTDGPFGAVAGLGADAFTANPLLGRDALEPLLEAADARRRRRASCSSAPRTPARPRSRTSRPTTPLRDAPRAPGRRARRRPASARAGLSDVGAVTGATRPELLAELREQMPRAIFLLPGVGAQGGRAEDLGAGVRAASRGRARRRVALDRRRPRRGRRRPRPRRRNRRPRRCASPPGELQPRRLSGTLQPADRSVCAVPSNCHGSDGPGGVRRASWRPWP